MKLKLNRKSIPFVKRTHDPPMILSLYEHVTFNQSLTYRLKHIDMHADASLLMSGGCYFFALHFVIKRVFTSNPFYFYWLHKWSIMISSFRRLYDILDGIISVLPLVNCGGNYHLL